VKIVLVCRKRQENHPGAFLFIENQPVEKKYQKIHFSVADMRKKCIFATDFRQTIC